MTVERKRRALRCVVVCVLLFAVSNFAMGALATMFRRGALPVVLALVCYGAIGAQAALHAIWCVLAPVGLARRLTVGLVVALILFGAGVLGFALFEGWGRPGGGTWIAGAVGGLLCLPLVAVAVQAPLWVAKCWFRWRVVLPPHGSCHAGDRAFGIREMLVAMGVVAIALSATQLAAPFTVSPATFLGAFAIVVLTLAGLSLFTTLPAVVATLRARRMSLALPTLLVFDVAIAIGAIAIFAVATPEGRSMRWREYVYLATMAGAYFAWLTGVMLVVRRLGLRLFWGRRQHEPCR